MSKTWTEELLNFWNNKGVALNQGATYEDLSKVEKELEFEFPADFKALYLKVNGFKDRDWLPNMFSIWSLERIVEEYKGDRKKEFVCFADYLISSHEIGFSKNRKGIFTIHETPSHIANTFEEVIILINSNAEEVY